MLPVFTFSQIQEGTPFIKNYKPSEYKASTDNWAVAQDKRGIMYFGNATGVLEYDGDIWTLYPVNNNSLVRSLAIDNDGIIYVGAVGEFGYLAPNTKGTMQYHSLVNLLPENEREFADVWKTYATPDGVYFQTFTKLIRIKNKTVKIWKPENTFHFSFFVNNTLYINEKGIGLKKLQNETLQLVADGDLFAGLRIYSMLPYSSHEILIATREKGLFVMDGSKHLASIIQMQAEANDRLINDQVYGGVAFGKNTYAYATLLNGVLIINEKGDVVQCLNKKNGLQDDIVKYVGIDNQYDLWIALGKGIAHAEISLPLNSLSEAQGLKGFIGDITKVKGVLYVATSLGVYAYINNQFVAVEGINSHTWSLLKFVSKQDTILLASSETGVFEINKTTSKFIQAEYGFVLHQSKSNPNRIYIGMGDGLTSIKYDKNKWINEDYFSGIDYKIKNIEEDEKGNLWLGTPVDGLMKVDFNSGITDTLSTSWHAKYAIHFFDTANGLPSMENNIPYQYKNNIVFATYSGMYQFNKTTSTFAQSNFLKKELYDTQVYRFAPKDSSVVWMFTVRPDQTKETGIAIFKKNDLYEWYTQPFLKISDREIHAIFPDENGVTWLGAPDGLLRYDASIKKDFAVPFYAHIRIIKSLNDTLFGGNFYVNQNGINTPITNQLNHLKPVLKYINNSITFDFSATTYSDEQNNQFSYYLEGHEKVWSDWSTKKEKEYSDLDEGDYIFHVKAKSIYKTISLESTFAFTILPPWYRTIWAYIGYVLGIIGFIYLIVRLSVRRLVKAKNLLEATVKERTAEVVEQKHLIEEKHKEITDSINYAERIQRSFLASTELLNENLKDYFVFFQPKDVVSGDFYWATKLISSSGVENFALVTADSTGHGVPGAIMSILNISSLENTVKEGVCEPAEILNQTRIKIIERLKKDGSAEGGKDGMDASLLCFDFINNKLSYAAANNPVWIVRENEMLEFAPDKMPVGKHDKDSVSFTQHSIDLQKNDVVYALTDGMPDQFGGPKGKKFMYKKLKELLVSCSGLPMNEQKELLKSTFNDWKGNLEQVDDVCLIGIRI